MKLRRWIAEKILRVPVKGFDSTKFIAESTSISDLHFQAPRWHRNGWRCIALLPTHYKNYHRGHDQGMEVTGVTVILGRDKHNLTYQPK